MHSILFTIVIGKKYHVIVLTVFEQNEKIFEAIKAGADGYLLKDDSAVNIIDAITNVVEYMAFP